MSDKFEQWWSVYQFKKDEERYSYYDSLSDDEQNMLKQSFFEYGWHELICKNHINQSLDYIKQTYNIDLLDLRIKAIKFNRIFLIEQYIWNTIEEMMFEYDSFISSDIFFYGLKVKSWGKHNRFVVISAKKKGTIDA